MQTPGPISPDGKWWWNGTQWLPYQQPSAGAPGWPYESPGFRARMTSIFLMTYVGGAALLTLGSVATDLYPNASDNAALVIGLVALLGVLAWAATQIPSVVFFCMWLHRVIRNMPAVGSPDPRWSPARAVVYCFIPIINLVHPLFSVLDAWRGADPSRRWLDSQTRKAIRAPRLIAAWWALWLVGGYGFNIAARLSGPPAAVLDVISGGCSIAAAIFCIRVVQDVTARQDKKQELIGTGQIA